MKSRIMTSPARISQTTGDRPRIEGPSSFGLIAPHSEENRTPKTTSPMPSAQSSDPSRSRWGRSSTGVSAIRRPSSTMPAPTQTSPANHPRPDRYVVASPPISGPTAIAIAPAAPMRPYARGRPPCGKFPATSATIAGMIKAAPIPSRTDHPQMRTPRVVRESRVERPGEEESEPENEGPLAPDHRADLPASDHQHRHHQRVEDD